jgi:L-fuconolactonase
MRLADAHMHLFRHGYRHDAVPPLFGSRELESYEALRETYGIDLALVVGYEGDGIDPDNNDYILDLSRSRRWLRTVAYVDPCVPCDPAAIKALLERGHYGLSLYVTDAERAGALLRWPNAAWDVLQEHRAIISFNARPEAIDLLRVHLSAFSETVFLFSHLGLPGLLAPDASRTAVEARLASLLPLAELPNCYVKISGLYGTSQPAYAYPHPGAYHAIRAIIDEFGPARCVWGSDFAPSLEFVSFPQTIHIPGYAELPEAEKNLIFRENLVRLLAGRSGAD